ncbi:hypothetical protein RB195_011901 [Necator americanus]|uniref:Uncharacterized protein n=1 Tax=Necator americanus TaxID=51031 RepID=A0ABR1D6G4_NECAM
MGGVEPEQKRKKWCLKVSSAVTVCCTDKVISSNRNTWSRSVCFFKHLVISENGRLVESNRWRISKTSAETHLLLNTHTPFLSSALTQSKALAVAWLNKFAVYLFPENLLKASPHEFEALTKAITPKR